MLLREALGLWRGPPLSDVPSELLQQEVVPALVERWLGALESRIEADLVLGRHGEVLPELLELTTRYPLRERFWAQRMLALYRSGRQGEALTCYRTVSRLLAEELGIDPGAQLGELHQQVLTADPALIRTGGQQRGDAPATGNLPAEMTTFVGRERQLGQAQQLLEINRRTRVSTLRSPPACSQRLLAVDSQVRESANVPPAVTEQSLVCFVAGRSRVVVIDARSGAIWTDLSSGRFPITVVVLDKPGLAHHGKGFGIGLSAGTALAAAFNGTLTVANIAATTAILVIIRIRVDILLSFC